MGDGGAFHFYRANIRKLLAQGNEAFRLVHKGIGGADKAPEVIQFGGEYFFLLEFGDGLFRFGYQGLFIGKNLRLAGELSRRVIKGGNVYIMVQKAGGNNDIAKMQGRIDAAGGTGINDKVRLKIIDEQGATDRSADLANSATQKGDIASFKRSLIKLKSANFG